MSTTTNGEGGDKEIMKDPSPTTTEDKGKEAQDEGANGSTTASQAEWTTPTTTGGGARDKDAKKDTDDKGKEAEDDETYYYNGEPLSPRSLEAIATQPLILNTKGGARDKEFKVTTTDDKGEDELTNGLASTTATSPRRKPRKQQLPTTTTPFSGGVEEPQIFYKEKGRKMKKTNLFGGGPGGPGPSPPQVGVVPPQERPSSSRGGALLPNPYHTGIKAALANLDFPVSYHFKRDNGSLLESNPIPADPLYNHFQKYSDVLGLEEETLNKKKKKKKAADFKELVNSEDILERISQWRMMKVSNHLGDMVENETDIMAQYAVLESQLEEKMKTNPNPGLAKILDMLKANSQRCKVVREQMAETKAETFKLLEHFAGVKDVIDKFKDKQPEGEN